MEGPELPTQAYKHARGLKVVWSEAKTGCRHPPSKPVCKPPTGSKSMLNLRLSKASGRFASDGAQQITPRRRGTEAASLWVQCQHTIRDEPAMKHCLHAKEQDDLLLRLRGR